MPRYQKISPEVKKQLEQQLADKYKKTPRKGMSSKLLRGDDVEKHLTQQFTEYSGKAEKEIDKRTKEAIASLNARIDAVLRYMQSVVQSKVDSIKQPQDGHTPTREEITAALLPLVDETKKEYEERISKVEKFLEQTPDDNGVPKDVESLEAFVKSKIPKDLGGGGGPGYFFELFDTPQKVGGLRGAYRGYEGQFVKVSADGKGLEFGTGGGGSTTFTALTDTPADYTSQGGRAVVVNGDEDGLEFADFPSGTGDVTAASSFANDNRLIRSDGTGKGVQASGITIDDSNNISGNGTIENHETTTQLNARDTANRNRANHTGTQAASTITGLADVATSGDYNDLSNLPDLTAFDNLSVHANEAAFPATGDTDKLYLAEDTGELFRWTGSEYVGVSTDHAPVTLAGTPNYLTIAGQVITRALIDLASHVTNRLPFANITTISTNKLLGRTTAGVGNIEEVGVDGGLEFNGANVRRSALTGAITANAGNNNTSLGSFTKSQLNTAVSDGNVVYEGDNVSDLTNDAGYTTNTGTVTSVAATVPTGLTITGSPITTSGTLAIGLDTDRVIPTQTTLDGKVEATKTADQDYAGFDIKDIGLSTFRINAIGNSSTSFNLNWNDGAYQSVTLTGNAIVGTQTAPTIDASNGVRMQLDIVQDATGGRDFTPPTNWVFPDGEPTWTDGTANQRIIVTIMFNGTNYVCTYTPWFTNP